MMMMMMMICIGVVVVMEQLCRYWMMIVIVVVSLVIPKLFRAVIIVLLVHSLQLPRGPLVHLIVRGSLENSRRAARVIVVTVATVETASPSLQKGSPSSCRFIARQEFVVIVVEGALAWRRGGGIGRRRASRTVGSAVHLGSLLWRTVMMIIQSGRVLLTRREHVAHGRGYGVVELEGDCRTK